ncbi:gustatory and pheromone receptor 39a-like isoform X2 [Eupeodes corollae]|uniref:gustatory and pheromone receptor 39a-like isoform X2 n=1 Tax=Eupeodes corollae TaxID=290404 RepID=UPI002493B060|nr:gustatory and pheromone receptor 39a-like isoform X2 [Eupeodes corollae]
MYCALNTVNTVNYESTTTKYMQYGSATVGLSQVIVHLYIYFNKDKLIEILNEILQIEKKYQKITGINDKTLLIFIFYLLICFTCTSNMLYSYISVGFSHIFYILQSLIYESQLIFSGLIQIFCTSLIIIIRKRLININEEFEKCVNLHGIQYLNQLLEDRSEILNLCEVKISSLYGTPLIFLFLGAIINVVGGFYYTSYIFDGTIWFPLEDYVTVIVYNLLFPMLQFMLFPCFLFLQDCTEEANKTARILSRISRRGTDIEKMVDKFLMKNLQQRPILTAYGFFPLNKRTLFKIFAAIFTYMVILIQFKDMENTNKKLVGTKTTTL